MAAKKRPVARKKRSPFRELMSGVEAMKDHREGRLTLKTREVRPITVPPIDADVVRETRAALKMSRHVFAFKIGVNPRTLERWEQGRSKPKRAGRGLDLAGAELPRHAEEVGVASGFSLSLRLSRGRRLGAPAEVPHGRRYRANGICVSDCWGVARIQRPEKSVLP
jgi:putative transcriptional regulator